MSTTRCDHVTDHPSTVRAFRAGEWLEVIVRGNMRDPLPHMDLDWLFGAMGTVLTYLAACDDHHRATCCALTATGAA